MRKVLVHPGEARWPAKPLPTPDACVFCRSNDRPRHNFTGTDFRGRHVAVMVCNDVDACVATATANRAARAS